MRLSVAVAVACLSIAGLSVAADVKAAIRKNTEIAAQGLGPALQLLAKEHGFQIVYVSDEVNSLRTQGASGELTAQEALTQLLNGTGLTFRSFGDNAVSIVPVAAGGASESGGRVKQSATWFRELRLAQAEEGSSSESSTNGSDRVSQGDQPRVSTLEEVVVTAQKREERLQDVPISISVLDGASLDSATSETLNDVMSQVAGVYSYDSGQNGGTKFSIRGVTSNTSLFSGSGTVGYYLDEVPFGFVRIPVTPDANAYDMERVEILRGPQGTLYGTNSVNGVIRIVTKDADLDDVEFKVRASGSSTEEGGENYRADAAVNVPIVSGKLALRTVLGYADYSGWLDQPAQEDVNSAEQKTVRAKLNGLIGADTTVELSAWVNRDDRDGPSIGPERYVSYGVGDQPISTDYDIYGVTLQHDFPSFSVLSATNHMKYDSIGILSLANGTASQTTNIGADLLSEELRLSSTRSGRWQWSLGAMYRDAEDEIITSNTVQVLPNDDVYRSKSYAVFGEVKYGFADGLFDLTAGLRYFHDTVTLRQRSLAGVGTPVDPITDEESFNSVTPRVVLTWHPQDDLIFYASYSQGFRSGFMQAPQVLAIAPSAPPVKEDLLSNYEIGVKGVIGGGRVSYDAAAYYIDWKDSQQQIFAPLSLGRNLAIPFNSDGLSGPGFDLDVTARLTDSLTLGVGGSWNGLGFDEEVRAPANNALIFKSGERPDESPETTARIALDYTAAIGSGGFKGQFATSANYVTSTTSHSSVSGVEFLGDSFLNVQARISLLAPHNWVATLYGDNLANENPIIRPVAGAMVFSSRIRPRTLGLQLEYQF